MDKVSVLLPQATDRSYGTPRAIPLLYIILPKPPVLSLQPSLLLTPSEPLTGLLNVLGPHFRNKVVRLLCPALSLAWSSSHPSAGPIHMQVLTVFVFYIIPSTKQKQCTALPSRAITEQGSTGERKWRETDQIFTAREEEIVNGSVIQLHQ